VCHGAHREGRRLNVHGLRERPLRGKLAEARSNAKVRVLRDGKRESTVRSWTAGGVAAARRRKTERWRGFFLAGGPADRARRGADPTRRARDRGGFAP